MTTWILAVLLLYFVQLLLPPVLGLVQSDNSGDVLNDAMRGKDNAPALTGKAGRIARAQNNLQESLPIFLALALLLEIHGVKDGQGVLGAQIFLGARVLYIPIYVAAIPGVRTAVWSVGCAGLVMMALAAL